MWENQGMLRLSAGLMERSFNNLINQQICMQQPILYLHLKSGYSM